MTNPVGRGTGHVGKFSHIPVPVDSNVRLSAAEATSLILDEYGVAIPTRRFNRWCREGKVVALEDVDGEFHVLREDALAAFQAVGK